MQETQIFDSYAQVVETRVKVNPEFDLTNILIL
jgi:hypothetical protein